MCAAKDESPMGHSERTSARSCERLGDLRALTEGLSDDMPLTVAMRIVGDLDHFYESAPVEFLAVDLTAGVVEFTISPPEDLNA